MSSSTSPSNASNASEHSNERVQVPPAPTNASASVTTLSKTVGYIGSLNTATMTDSFAKIAKVTDETHNQLRQLASCDTCGLDFSTENAAFQTCEFSHHHCNTCLNSMRRHVVGAGYCARCNVDAMLKEENADRTVDSVVIERIEASREQRDADAADVGDDDLDFELVKRKVLAELCQTAKRLFNDETNPKIFTESVATSANCKDTTLTSISDVCRKSTDSAMEVTLALEKEHNDQRAIEDEVGKLRHVVAKQKKATLLSNYHTQCEGRLERECQSITKQLRLKTKKDPENSDARIELTPDELRELEARKSELIQKKLEHADKAKKNREVATSKETKTEVKEALADYKRIVDPENTKKRVAFSEAELVGTDFLEKYKKPANEMRATQTKLAKKQEAKAKDAKEQREAEERREQREQLNELEQQTKELKKFKKEADAAAKTAAKTVAEQKAHIEKLSSTLGESTSNLESVESQSIYFKNRAARDSLFLDSILEPAEDAECLIGDADLMTKLRKARADFEAQFCKRDNRPMKRKRCEELDAEYEAQMEKRNKRDKERAAAAEAAAAQ
jgi:hypothetical protein